MNTTTVTAQLLADKYIEIVRFNEATDDVIAALLEDPDHYEVTSELMDVAVLEMGYDHDGSNEKADALGELAHAAAVIVLSTLQAA
jgi:Tfp pilus assembly protein FimV